ncbi:MAG: HEAT repeat domain-containing protein, partial [Acidobacteriota bacterium]
KLTLNAKQTQKIDVNNEYPQTAYFQSWVDVEIDNRVERVWLKPQEENVFTFDSAIKPKLVSWDFESSLLKEMKFEKSTDDLLYQMANDKDVIGRRWAMGELQTKAKAGTDKERIVSALLTSAEKDPFFRIRRAAVTIAADIYSPDPPPGQEAPAAKLPADVEQSMVRLTKDANPLVQAEAIQLLGETRDPKHTAVYLSFLNDRSYGVIDAASEALGRTKDARAYDALVKLTQTPSWKGRIQIAGLHGLGELGDKRAFDVGLKAATDKTLPAGARAAALAIVGTTGKGDPRAFPIIFDVFKQALASDNEGSIVRSIGGIIELGDPRGQEAFDMLKAKYKDDADIMRQIAQFEAAFKAAIKK